MNTPLPNPTSNFFKYLFGFDEFPSDGTNCSRYLQNGDLRAHSPKTYRNLQNMFSLTANDTVMTSLANQRLFQIGSFNCASARDLFIEVIAQGLLRDWSDVAENSRKARRKSIVEVPGIDDDENFLPAPTPKSRQLKHLKEAYGLFGREMLERERCESCTAVLMRYVKHGRRSLVEMNSKFATPTGEQAVEEESKHFGGDKLMAKKCIFKQLTAALLQKYQSHLNLDKHLLCKKCAQKPAMPIRRKRSIIHDSTKNLICHLSESFEALEVCVCASFSPSVFRAASRVTAIAL